MHRKIQFMREEEEIKRNPGKVSKEIVGAIHRAWV
jgi:hypothetical protein